MSLNTVRALLILNAAKKGWSESARKKAAATRKAKKKRAVGSGGGYIRTQAEKGSSAHSTALDALNKKVKASKYGAVGLTDIYKAVDKASKHTKLSSAQRESLVRKLRKQLPE